MYMPPPPPHAYGFQGHPQMQMSPAGPYAYHGQHPPQYMNQHPHPHPQAPHFYPPAGYVQPSDVNVNVQHAPWPAQPSKNESEQAPAADNGDACCACCCNWTTPADIKLLIIRDNKLCLIRFAAWVSMFLDFSSIAGVLTVLDAYEHALGVGRAVLLAPLLPACYVIIWAVFRCVSNKGNRPRAFRCCCPSCCGEKSCWCKFPHKLSILTPFYKLYIASKVLKSKMLDIPTRYKKNMHYSEIFNIYIFTVTCFVIKVVGLVMQASGTETCELDNETNLRTCTPAEGIKLLTALSTAADGLFMLVGAIRHMSQESIKNSLEQRIAPQQAEVDVSTKCCLDIGFTIAECAGAAI
eukprot:tig00000344_g24297.t1